MISLKNITLRRGSKVLLGDVSITIQPGEKVGLIGRNGAGKSSLFALLSGKLHEDKGDFSIPKEWLMAEVAQDMPETDEPATDFVTDGDVRLARAQAELLSAEASGDGMAIAHAHTALLDAGVHDARARAETLLMGLGFNTQQLQNPVNSFSGGWRMRLQLARALMCPSDILLLDEPTNHLDLDALVWLESWLVRYAGTLVVISHDREFLDAITKVTLHIEQGGITRYGGNYTQFEILRSQAIELQTASFAKQQERIAHLQKFIDRFKAKASKAKQAQSRVKALERMERIAPVLTSSDFAFEFKEPDALPNPMLSLRDTAMGYFKDAPEQRHSDSEQLSSEELDRLFIAGTEPVTILQGISCSVQAGQRIGILGANGQGKSTFVKTIAGTLPLVSGKLTEGKGLKIGYFAQQELDVLSPADNPLTHMMRLSRDMNDGKREQDWRNFLGQFQFRDEMVKQAVGTMSGGEKARLVLAMLVWQRPNLLLLDEPTNHLDITTREALSMALNEFEGTMLLVSHDRSLLRETCDEFWLVSKGGMQPFVGDLDDYQKYLLDLSKELAAAAKKSTAAGSKQILAEAAPATQAKAKTPAAANPATPPVASKEQRKLDAQRRQQREAEAKPHQRHLSKLEAQLDALNQEKTALQTALLTPQAPDKIAEIGKRLKQIEEDLAYAESAWLDVSETLQNLQSGA